LKSTQKIIQQRKYDQELFERRKSNFRRQVVLINISITRELFFCLRKIILKTVKKNQVDIYSAIRILMLRMKKKLFCIFKLGSSFLVLCHRKSQWSIQKSFFGNSQNMKG